MCCNRDRVTFFLLERILLGDNEGLYMMDITDDGLYKFSDREIRKVTQIAVIKEEGLIALLAGEWVCVIPGVLIPGAECY